MENKNKYEIIEGSENQTPDDFYKNFKEKLKETHTFPCDYMFKYILPSDEDKIARLYAIFNDPKASFSSRPSKTGKYTSFTIKIPVTDADDVILYYRQAAKIEGIVML